MKKLVILLILIFAAVFGRSFLFNMFFRYEIIKERGILYHNKETIAVDPALYDYFRIDKITLK
ncbi:hypothetical protein NZD88_11360 [Chryseobacterium antibioticum]|uniref:Uncharacterized protein n=1 Tax=Chryseobacterium pyrolae TaxID=2987481 RepID=A0ABT2IHM3_9FLAO|nr:hypothetical protein [Chryseobacterium pyrolae]MCT2408139.1 hypothetical protein [Chryseobacterium pyrolae]